MATRASWKGYLKFSLVSIPVKGYSAANTVDAISLNQLHAKCHRRINYKKICPVHGEVGKEEIVSGYEYAKGQYVVIEPQELATLRAVGDKAINLEAVIPAASIDPLYFTEKTYYLVPDGNVGQKPFVLLQTTLADGKLAALARAVLFSREELVLVRPMENLLALTVLRYENEVMQPDVIAEEVESPQLSAEELQLTATLVKAFAKKKVSLADYRDEYVDRLTQFIEAKVAGKEIVMPPQTEEPQVINLMDALKRSVAETGGRPDPKKKARAKTVPAAARSSRPPRGKRRRG